MTDVDRGGQSCAAFVERGREVNSPGIRLEVALGANFARQNLRPTYGTECAHNEGISHGRELVFCVLHDKIGVCTA